MKKISTYRSAFLNPRILISFAFCALGVLVALLAFSLYSGGHAFAQVPLQDESNVPDFVEDVNVAQGTVVRITATPLDGIGVFEMPAPIGQPPLASPPSPSDAANDIALTLNVSPADPQASPTPTPRGRLCCSTL